MESADGGRADEPAATVCASGRKSNPPDQGTNLAGNMHVIDKVRSLFEPHTEVIRKGKAHKPSEFGRLARIDELENGIVSGYALLAGNLADTNSFVPALGQHLACFGRAPAMATGDREALSRCRTNAKPRSRGQECSAAGPGALIEQASRETKAALVPTRVTLASRLRSHHQHTEASVLDVGSYS